MHRPVIVRIDANNLQWRVCQDGDSWVAVCDALRLTTWGDTWSDLTESINDVLGDLFKQLMRKGELPRFLSERGWRPVAVPTAPPEDVTFDVPWTPVRAPANELHCG